MNSSFGQLFMFGIEGAVATPEILAHIKETGAGGVILFPKGESRPKVLKEFVAKLNDCADSPLIVAIDQEGGRVARLKKNFTEFPPMREVGALGPDEAASRARDIGRTLGQDLRRIGIVLDFAPVLDVDTNPYNPVIGDRSFSRDPEVVSKLGIELFKGLTEEGVAACGKHFPGHGDTDADSHTGLTLIPHTRRRLEACELKPFRAAIEAGIPAMMTAHVMFPSLDDRYPATISRRITMGLLRREMNFGGIIFTDDLRMEGIALAYPPEESAWRAIAAGADIALICGGDLAQQRRVLDVLKKAVDEGALSEDIAAEALGRIAGFKSRWCCKRK